MENIPPPNVINAIEKYDGSYVSASDLSSSAGISLNRARRELTNVAALSRGDIAVNENGELMYKFPKDVSGTISNYNVKYRALKIWNDKVYPPLLYGTKLGFGMVLFASLVLIFSTIFFVLSSGGSGNRDEDRRDNRRGGGGMGGMPMMGGGFWGPSPFDFFYYRPYYSRYYYSPVPGIDDGGSRRGGRQKRPDEMGFLESVFSYVFGDGNPNGDVEARRISLAANMIRANGGAVTAEQLAPYCDDAPMPLGEGEERAYVDEGFVLPIVTQLDGEPRVTDEGDIVYVFPELMTSASSSSSSTSGKFGSTTARGEVQRTAAMTRESRILRRAGLDEDAPTSMIGRLLAMNGISTRGALERSDLINILEKALPNDGGDDAATNVDVDDPSLLLEREFKFSLASPLQTILAGLLGVVNLGGALYLGNLLGQYAIYGVRLPSYMGLVQQFFPLLLGYAVLFNAVPLARNFWINGQNEKIRRRNEVRRSWRARLEEKASDVGRKLLSAARFGKRMRQLGAGGEGDIVFDTSMGSDELDKVREREAMRDFDKVLMDGKDNSWE
jgi:pilus assembly protein TadC